MDLLRRRRELKPLQQSKDREHAVRLSLGEDDDEMQVQLLFFV